MGTVKLEKCTQMENIRPSFPGILKGPASLIIYENVSAVLASLF